MAIIQFSAYTIHEVFANSVSISVGIGQAPPFPTRQIEARNVAQVREQFDAYVAEAYATGKRLQCSARVHKGRAPNGFNQVTWCTNVNV